MSDTAQLQAPLLYHGTRVGFRKGGFLFPQAFHGHAPRPGHSGDESTRYAYATLDREMAEFYALNDKGRGRPKVLTVEPMGPCEPDPSRYDNEHGHQVRCADGFRVVAVEIVEVNDGT